MQIYMWLKDKALTAAGQGRSKDRPPAGEGSPDTMDDSAQ